MTTAAERLQALLMSSELHCWKRACGERPVFVAVHPEAVASAALACPGHLSGIVKLGHELHALEAVRDRPERIGAAVDDVLDGLLMADEWSRRRA